MAAVAAEQEEMRSGRSSAQGLVAHFRAFGSCSECGERGLKEFKGRSDRSDGHFRSVLLLAIEPLMGLVHSDVCCGCDTRDVTGLTDFKG